MPSLEIIPNILVAMLFFAYWMVVFVILYHLTRFGVGTQPKKFAAIFLFGSVVLFCSSLILYMNLDLSAILPR